MAEGIGAVVSGHAEREIVDRRVFTIDLLLHAADDASSEVWYGTHLHPVIFDLWAR